MILGVTGHRPPKLGGYRIPNPIYEAVCERIDTMLQTLAPTRILTGMALGVDQWVAEICVTHHIPFIAVIPFEGFSSKWPEESRRQFDYLCSRAESVRLVTATREYRPGLLQTRNKWIVDNCTEMLAVYNGSAGGTANCVEYATRRGKNIRRVELPQEIWREAARVEMMLAERSAERKARSMRFNPDVLYPRMPVPTEAWSSNRLELYNDPQVGIDLARQHDLSTLEAIIQRTSDEARVRHQVAAAALNRTYEDIRGNVVDALGETLGAYSSSRVIVTTDSTGNPQAPTEAQPEPTKEKISAGSGFKPGRLIDLDD
jgi:uncharacterized phage-like protein YoqJ